MKIGTSGTRDKGMKDQLRGHKIKGKGHRRTNLNSETWRRHHSPLSCVEKDF